MPDPSLSPELVQAQAFTSSFRGYDQGEVRDFLQRVSAELRALRDRASQLETAWHSAEERAARPPVLDEDTLMAAVGDETASILRAARGAAADMRARAEQDAERIRSEAGATAERIRAEAEGVLSRETQVAEEAAARIVEGARTEAAEMLDKTRTDADGIRASAIQEKQLTIEGATATRERILDDLARRRRVAAVQIEQLRAGRERLLESYAVVRRTLEEVHNELTRADAEARAAADEAGRRMQREHPPEPVPDAGIPPAGQGTPAAGQGAADLSSEPEANGSTVETGEAAGAEPAAPAGAGEAAPQGAAPGQQPAGRSPSVTATSGVTSGSATPTATATSPGARSNRRGGREGAGGPAVASAEALAAVSDHPSAPQPAEALVPHLRVVPNPVERPGGKVDQLFARIRAGRADRQKEPAKDGPPVAEQPVAEAGQEEAATAAGFEAREPEAPGSETPDSETPESETPDSDTVVGVAAAAGDAEVTGSGADVEADATPAEPESARSDDDEALLQRREEALVDLEMSLTRKLKRALQDEQNDLLDRLRNLRGEPTAARLLPNRDEQVSRYVSAAQPLVDKAAAAGVAFAVETLDRKGRANASAPPVADLAREAAISIVDALRRRLEQAITASIGDEQQVMVEAVGGAYREWKSQRIERIAGDALAAAFARGTWSEVPDGTPLRWVVDDVDGPCPDCDDDALAGHLPKGEAFPTGQRHPPAHSGCHCLLVPVVG